MWNAKLAQVPVERRTRRKWALLLLFARLRHALDLYTNTDYRWFDPLDNISETERRRDTNCIYFGGSSLRAVQQVANREPRGD